MKKKWKKTIPKKMKGKKRNWKKLKKKVICSRSRPIFRLVYDQSSFIATEVPMYVINVNDTKTFIWKFINLVVPGRIWVKYSKLFYRVKAVDRNLLSAFPFFEMYNGTKALIKSQMYFIFQMHFQRVQTLPSGASMYFWPAKKKLSSLRDRD